MKYAGGPELTKSGGTQLTKSGGSDQTKSCNRYTGESRVAQIFVAVLGCSNLSYAEATWSQGSADWLGSQVRALQYVGDVPRAIVPDNLKSGVTKAHRYEPEINPAYQVADCPVTIGRLFTR